jgi:hypothetical protein
MKLHLAIAASLAIPFLMACSDDDTATVATTDAMAETGVESDAGVPEDGGGGGDATVGDSGPAIDGALPPEIDAAGVDANAGTNAFSGAGPYVATLGPTSQRKQHSPTDNPAGQACMTCHNGSKGNVAEFLVGGTVYTTPAATAPAPSAEIRVREGNGNILTTFSDADGNFFVLRNGRGPLLPPARAGARDAKSLHLMVNLINNGDCNSCHKPGGQARLNVQ